MESSPLLSRHSKIFTKRRNSHSFKYKNMANNPLLFFSDIVKMGSIDKELLRGLNSNNRSL